MYLTVEILEAAAKQVETGNSAVRNFRKLLLFDNKAFAV